MEDANEEVVPRSQSRSPLPNEGSRSETPDIPWSPVGDPLSNLTDKLAAAHAAAAAVTVENTSNSSNAMRAIESSSSASSPTISLQPPTNTALGPGFPRRLSYLTPIDLATGAISTADQGIRGIGNTLESSYKFLFGKMEKRGEELPRTLEDARKLVDSPVAGNGFQEEKTAALIDTEGGLKRVASEASIGSLKRETEITPATPPRATTPAAAAAEKLGSLGTSLGRFAVRGFSRSSTPAAATTLTQTEVLTGAAKGLGIVTQDKGHKRNDSSPVADLLSVRIPSGVVKREISLTHS